MTRPAPDAVTARLDAALHELAALGPELVEHANRIGAILWAPPRFVVVGRLKAGKSTLVNALVPGSDRETGEVNVVTGRGRHTSTSAVALAVPGGGWVVDTPGIRSFGLAHVDAARLILAFPDLAAATEACPRGCTHAAGEPECALDIAAAEGRVTPDRVTSFRRLLDSRERQPGD